MSWETLANLNPKSIPISDLNDAIETGFYNCYSADNAPSTGFFTIEVNTDGNNVIQTATNANGEMYTRIGYDVQNNPSWAVWTRPESNGSETAQSILDKLKTVDGIGSGLDAEYLGGEKYDKYASKVDLGNLTNQLLNEIGDNLTTECYTNGILIRRNGNIIYGRCWGSVLMTTTSSNQTVYTTINYPFILEGTTKTSMANAMGDPFVVGASTDQTQTNSVRVMLKRTTAGSTTVKWNVEAGI